MIKPIILLTIAILTVPTAYAQLDSSSTQYNFDSAKFEFADDLGNIVDLKFDRKGQLKLFEIILYDYNYNESNLQFSRFDTNKTDGSFSAFAFSDKTVIFLDFKISNSTFSLDLYHDRADRTPTKLHFTGPNTKQYPTPAENDIAILLVVETAKILKIIQELQTDHVTISMAQYNPMIKEVAQTEIDIGNTTKRIDEFKYIRNTFEYGGNFTVIKKSISDMREAYVIAKDSYALTENHHEIILSKINTKKIGPIHWEEFEKQQRLKNVHEKALSVQTQLEELEREFSFVNNTGFTMWNIEKNKYKSSEEVADFRKWLERR